MGIRVTINSGSLLKRIKGIEERAPLELKEGLRRIGDAHLATMRNRMRGTGRGQGPTQSVQTRSGFLRNSLGKSLEGEAIADLKLRLFSAGTSYANAQEFGGTIRPKKGRFLTVPMPDNLYPSGVVKDPSAARLRDDPTRSTFVLKAKGGKGSAFIAERKKNGQLKLLFKLVPSVTLRPRLGWIRTWRQGAPQREVIMSNAVSRIIGQSRGQ